jgi:hypothetical protein
MQPAIPMTYLTTVAGSFHAKVVAARLGTEGIPAQMRGGVDGLYPIFVEVQIYVRADQVDLARQLLLADAVDAVFEDAAERDAKDAAAPRAARNAEGRPGGRLAALGSRRVLALLTLAIAVMLIVVGMLASAI